MVFLITLLVVCVVLLLGFALSSSQNKSKVIGFFVEDADAPPSGLFPVSRKKSSSEQQEAEQTHTETAILQMKIDERRRIIDSSGHSKMYDEYFELVFETRKGETLHLVVSRATYKEIPFHQEGTLTYKNGVLVKFQYAKNLISDEYTTIQEQS